MKRFDITKHLTFNMGYKSGVEVLYPNFDKEAVIITDIPINDVHHTPIETLLIFKGTRAELTNELVDELLVTADTSYNPSRPFRWYKFTPNMTFTDDEQSIVNIRNESLNHVMSGIDNANYFYIYKIIIK